jgi:hypothetical protein
LLENFEDNLAETTSTIQLNEIPLFINTREFILGYEYSFVLYEERYRKMLQIALQGNGYFGLLPEIFINFKQFKNSHFYLG